VQLDPINPTLTAPGTNLLTVKYVESLSTFAFNSNLRRYSEIAEEGARSLGVGVATLTIALSEERLARRSLLNRIHLIAELENNLRSMEATEKLLRENLGSTQNSLDVARDELQGTTSKSTTLAADLRAANEALSKSQGELEMARGQLDHTSKNLSGSEHVLGLARKEGAAMKEEMLRSEEKMAGMETGQGLTLVHFSAQLEPFLTQNTP